MRRNPVFAFLLVVLLIGYGCSVVEGAENGKSRGLIQMAVLLDTSNSMDGLIEQAKSQIWKIVNELAFAKQNGRSPRLEVALYEYGNNNIPEGEGYLRMVVPLTTDLDKISEKLFQLTTNGGDEYCGKVITASVNNLIWNNSHHAFKVIVIAGNEPFTQGKVNYRQACKAAVANGIVINTIFCGDYQEGIETYWKDGADLTDGFYMNIDHNQKTIQIPAPQDGEIVKLGQKLNETYLAYGRKGYENKIRQEKEDLNAASMGSETEVQRSVAKASVLYENTGWDLVDAIKKDGFKVLDGLHEDELPLEIQKMTKEERIKYIQTKMSEREKIQKRLAQLNQERRLFIEKEMQKQAFTNTFDSVIIKAIRLQASKKNFKFNQ